MNTEKTHARFWEAMRARFGLRWLTDFGDKPSAPWVMLLNQYKPTELARAMELMAEQKLAHPPTLPIFEALLKKAAMKRADDGTDFVRGYWRSCIVDTILRFAALHRIIPWGETQLSALPPDVYRSMVRIAADQLNECVDTEKRTGQRTPGIEQAMNSTIWDALKVWQRAELPVTQPDDQPVQHAQGEAA